MKYKCNFCNGTGKQSGGLGCRVCKGTGFFNASEETAQCPSCKGSGRAIIRALPCISCRGRGVVLIGVKELQELQKPEAHIVKKRKEMNTGHRKRTKNLLNEKERVTEAPIVKTTKNLVNEEERVMEAPIVEKTKNLVNEEERVISQNIIYDIEAMRRGIGKTKSILDSIEKRLAELSDPAS